MKNQNETAMVTSVPADVPQPPYDFQEYNNQRIPQASPLVKQKQENSPFITIDGDSLMKMNIAPLQFSIENILPEGIFFISGEPKSGKSWAVLDMLTAVAIGGNFWGFKANKGTALYLALEDNYRRLQARLNQQETAVYEDISKFHFVISSPGIDSGLVTYVKGFIDKHPDTKIIAIDTFEYIRDGNRRDYSYSTDYKDIKALREIIRDKAVTLILVHHNRKSFDPNPMKKISGSTALTGATDGNWVFDREPITGLEAKMTISNRDTKSFCFKLIFDDYTCKWNFVGDWDECEKDEASVITAIDDFIGEDNPEWSGTASELLRELKKAAPDLKLTLATLSKELRKQEKTLEMEYNISVKFPDRKKNKKIIILSRNSVDNSAESVTGDG